MTGAGLVWGAMRAPGPPPQPAPAPVPAPSSEAGTGGPEIAIPESAPAAVEALARAAPTRLWIPQIDVNAEVMRVGIDAEGMVEVPDLAEAERAGWYERGPSPGENGNAVIVGHVDSEEIGPAVFYELGALVPGDEILIQRGDRSVILFQVDRVESHPIEEFPHAEVYAPAGQPQLRLITCGGRYDEARNAYPDNVIVYATAVATEPGAAQLRSPASSPTSEQVDRSAPPTAGAPSAPSPTNWSAPGRRAHRRRRTGRICGRAVDVPTRCRCCREPADGGRGPALAGRPTYRQRRS